jgi:selenide,water dikinase
MTRLNRAAAEALMELPPGDVHACTDVTGFGLIGHATEMAQASGCTLIIDTGDVPLLEGALELVEKNTPGGGRTNLDHFGAGVVVAAGLDPLRVQLLYDPQTSGGLLVAVAPGGAGAAMAALAARGVASHRVGYVKARETPRRLPYPALNGINLRLACSRTCPSSGSFSSSWS